MRSLLFVLPFTLAVFAPPDVAAELLIPQRPTEVGLPYRIGPDNGLSSSLPKLVSIAGSEWRSSGLTMDGTLQLFTSPRQVSLSVENNWNDLSDLTNLVRIIDRDLSAVFLRGDGRVLVRGQIDDPPTTLKSCVAIAEVKYSSKAVALQTDGTVVQWGGSFWGSDGAYRIESLPTPLTNAFLIAAGDKDFGAITRDGRVTLWGNGTFGVTPCPELVPNAKGMAIGWASAHVIREDGTVLSWGPAGLQSPAGLSNVVAITAGSTSKPTAGSPTNVDWAVALKADGTLAAWGDEYGGVVPQARSVKNVIFLGDSSRGGGPGIFVLRRAEPLPSVSAAPLSLPALPLARSGRVGKVVAWGLNTEGQLAVPLDATNVVAVSAGLTHTIALRNNGTVFGWGFNGNGQRSVPANVTNIAAIAAGYDHNIALSTFGKPFSWGYPDDRLKLPPTGFPPTYVTIAAGFQRNDMISPSSAEIETGFGSELWTSPFFGRTYISVVTSYGWTAVLRSDGTLLTWGRNNEGECSVPAGLNGVVAVARGYQHAMALRSDKTVVCWGRNSEGQTDVPAGLTNVVAIAGGSYHSVALRKDGTVVAWGGNSFGQLLVPTNLSRVFAITAGTKHTVTLVDPTPEIEVETGSSGQVTLALRGLIGQAYQLESSTTLGDWVSEGDSFTADRATVNRDVDVVSPAKFYRLREAQ